MVLDRQIPSDQLFVQSVCLIPECRERTEPCENSLHFLVPVGTADSSPGLQSWGGRRSELVSAVGAALTSTCRAAPACVVLTAASASDQESCYGYQETQRRIQPRIPERERRSLNLLEETKQPEIADSSE